MRTFDPAEHPVPLIQQILQSGVAPRPIALVSSMDAEGRRNLSPFSFYNAFGANPPVVVVSPAYRGNDGTPKHTYRNILATKEFTVSAVSYDMVDQASLASSDYAEGVDEFVKAGFTPLPSLRVRPPGVAESPFVMECRLLQAIETGGAPGSGNLLLAQVLLFRVRESAFEGDRIDPRRLDLVARMGHAWYCRAQGPALFELSKPRHSGIGIDALPAHLRESPLLTGAVLARLASVASPPDADRIAERWAQDLARLSPAAVAPDDLDTELAVGNPRAALLIILRAIRFGGREAELLPRLVPAFLAAGDLDRAWECALMAEPSRLAALRASAQ
jgi:flavin reductase (DIM6/NTAB) family NADH-FMN oxidoreductase RutF